MKKILVMVAVAMMTVVNVQAQEGYDDTKHEIGVSYGAMSNSTWMSIGDAMGTVIASLGAFRYDDGDFTGPISLEYFYHLSPVVGIGAIGAYAKETKDMFIGNERFGEAKNNYITVMPAAKFNWLRKKYFGMYSKVAAGLIFVSKKEDVKQGYTGSSDNSVGFNFQASAIGIEGGIPNLRAFIELGVGEQGVLLAGIRAKF